MKINSISVDVLKDGKLYYGNVDLCKTIEHVCIGQSVYCTDLLTFDSAYTLPNGFYSVNSIIEVSYGE